MHLPANTASHRTPSITSSGFTIIELLVAIAVLGVVATITLALINPAQRISETRDAQRKVAIGQIRNAIRTYYVKNQTFPPADVVAPVNDPGNPNYCPTGWNCSNNGPFLSTLVDEGYLKSVPLDPANDATYHFRYMIAPAGNAGCDVTLGQYYVLLVRAYEQAPAETEKFSCGSLNFDGFAAAYGEYEQ